MAASTVTLDTGHSDMIHDCQLDYYGRRLATASSDRTVKVWEVADDTQTLVAELKGHDGPVWQVAWAHPKWESVLASCSYDRTVRIWKEENRNTFTTVHEHRAHESSVNSISWAPHEFGLVLAAASSDGSVSLLAYKNDQWVDAGRIEDAHQIGVNAISWAPAVVPGTLLGGATGASQPPIKRFVTGGGDNNVKVWRYNDSENKWRIEDTLRGHEDWVRDVAWAPNIGLPSSTIASCSQDGSVIIWTQADLSSGGWKPYPLPKRNEPVWRLSWSVTGNILAVSSGDNSVTLYKEALDGSWSPVSSLDESSFAG